MIIGILKESAPSEKRVSMTPQGVIKAKEMGFEVILEKNAGALSGFMDEEYQKSGASLVSTYEELANKADILLKVNPFSQREDGVDELSFLQKKHTTISLIFPYQNKSLLEKIQATGATVLALDMVPRISRAQKIDVLSSTSNIAGYRAVTESLHVLGRFLGGQITAAGRIPPTKILVIGAGVAGLAAIGAAKSMGAEVYAFDTRKEVKEQIESLGGRFLTVSLDDDDDASSSTGYAKPASERLLEKELKLFAKEAPQLDIIITTAMIPGKDAPKLLDDSVLSQLKWGSVIVDLAAERGGNCTRTVKGKLIETESGVRVIGYTDLPSRMAYQASSLWSANVLNLLSELCQEKEGRIVVDEEDNMIRGLLVAKGFESKFPPPPIPVSNAPKKAPEEAPKVLVQKLPSFVSKWLAPFLITLLSLVIVLVSIYAPDGLSRRLVLFVLASIIGYQLIWSITPSLHTPLMSLTNAISGVGLFGAMMVMGTHGAGHLTLIFSGLAILLVGINTFGGLVVTKRMLSMFQR